MSAVAAAAAAFAVVLWLRVVAPALKTGSTSGDAARAAWITWFEAEYGNPVHVGPALIVACVLAGVQIILTVLILLLPVRLGHRSRKEAAYTELASS
jgi:hypothetical protein